MVKWRQQKSPGEPGLSLWMIPLLTQNRRSDLLSVAAWALGPALKQGVTRVRVFLHIKRFVDSDLAVAVQHRATLGHLYGRVH